MNGTLLLRLMLWDVRVQAREHIYLFTAVTTAAFAVAVALLPDDAPVTVITGILYLDPAVVGAGFVAGMVLLERSQNTMPASRPMPRKPALRAWFLVDAPTLVRVLTELAAGRPVPSGSDGRAGAGVAGALAGASGRDGVDIGTIVPRLPWSD